jgi:hypothetical protein
MTAPVTDPLEEEPDDGAYDGYVALRWRAAATALVLAGGAALLAHFPHWAVGSVSLLAAGTSLSPLPRRLAPVRLVSVVSFFFAQLTSAFVVPFTWPNALRLLRGPAGGAALPARGRARRVKQRSRTL